MLCWCQVGINVSQCFASVSPHISTWSSNYPRDTAQWGHHTATSQFSWASGSTARNPLHTLSPESSIFLCPAMIEVIPGYPCISISLAFELKFQILLHVWLVEPRSHLCIWSAESEFMYLKYKESEMQNTVLNSPKGKVGLITSANSTNVRMISKRIV